MLSGREGVNSWRPLTSRGRVLMCQTLASLKSDGHNVETTRREGGNVGLTREPHRWRVFRATCVHRQPTNETRAFIFVRNYVREGVKGALSSVFLLKHWRLSRHFALSLFILQIYDSQGEHEPQNFLRKTVSLQGCRSRIGVQNLVGFSLLQLRFAAAPKPWFS